MSYLERAVREAGLGLSVVARGHVNHIWNHDGSLCGRPIDDKKVYLKTRVCKRCKMRFLRREAA